MFDSYAKGDFRGPRASTPREAAEHFFAKYPRKRKCTVRELFLDSSGRFVVIFRIGGAGKSSRHWEGVTPKSAASLPTA